jgi:hypothetical protein
MTTAAIAIPTIANVRRVFIVRSGLMRCGIRCPKSGGGAPPQSRGASLIST